MKTKVAQQLSRMAKVKPKLPSKSVKAFRLQPMGNRATAADYWKTAHKAM